MTDTQQLSIVPSKVVGRRRRSLTPGERYPRQLEIIPVKLQNGLEPGVLLVVIHEARDLSVPQHGATLEHRSSSADITSSLPLLKDGTLPYATLELDGLEFSVTATSGTRENPVWSTKMRDRIHEKKFDIFRAADLTIRLYLKNLDHREGVQDVFLGSAQVTPRFGDKVQTEWLPIKNGAGEVHVEIEYVKNETLHIEMLRKPRYFGTSRLGPVGKIQKSGSHSFYATIHIQKSDLSPLCDVAQALLLPINRSNLVAPLKFVAQTPSEYCLFWPFAFGGHLFYHLQQAQRFHASRARLYAAEILVALEYIHEVDPSYHELKPKNFLLDSAGHVVVCDIGLLRLEKINMESTSDVAVDYLAPELLSGNASSTTDTTTSKWWMFGAFLFEMLTGLPPFYDEDVEQRRRNILSGRLVMSSSLPTSTQDLLIKLLTREPDKRLGLAGVPEIKAHRYFDGLDWDKVARREYVPAFKPHELSLSFAQEGLYENAESVEKKFSGWTYGKPVRGADGSTEFAAVKSHSIVEEKMEDWELVWERENQSYHFYNHSTKTKKSIDVPHLHLTKPHGMTQSQVLLAAVLKSKYMHLVPRLLDEHKVNLNFELWFNYTTPLNCVTKLQEVDIVRLFLANGADANFETVSIMGGRPLLSAVRNGNQELVKMLVQRTSRVTCTRALGHAVSNRDKTIVEILCTNGVKCDFNETDRPQPRPYREKSEFDIPQEANIEVFSEISEYASPLVRAISEGQVGLVQLLLAHGANVNAGYHGYEFLSGSRPKDMYGRVYIQCGRPIQLAMELENEHLVRKLLENGADISLPQPIWQHHDCSMIPREVYHQVTAQLRSIAALLEHKV